MSEPNPGPVAPATLRRTHPTKFIDMTGERLGRLVVIERAPNRGTSVFWLCQCDCGRTREVSRKQLRHSLRPTRSCGCLYDERLIDRDLDVQACQRPSAKYPHGRTGTRAGYKAHDTAGQTPAKPALRVTGERLTTAAMWEPSSGGSTG